MLAIIFNAVVQLVLLIACGMLLFRLGLVKEEHNAGINAILLHLGIPAMILEIFQSDLLFESTSELYTGLVISVYYMIFTLVLAFVLIRKSDTSGVERAAIAFTNNAFIGMPLLGATFGDIGVFFAAVTNFASSFLLWTLAPVTIAGDFSAKAVIKNALNDKTIIAIVAIILVFLNIRLPEIVMKPVGYLADTITPLAMISTGVMISTFNFRTVITKRALWVAFLRNVLTTLIVCLVMRFFVHDDEVFMIFAILVANPTGTMVAIMSKQYGKDSKLASGIFLASTVMSAVTMPLIAAVMELIIKLY